MVDHIYDWSHKIAMEQKTSLSLRDVKMAHCKSLHVSGDDGVNRLTDARGIKSIAYAIMYTT